MTKQLFTGSYGKSLQVQQGREACRDTDNCSGSGYIHTQGQKSKKIHNRDVLHDLGHLPKSRTLPI